MASYLDRCHLKYTLFHNKRFTITEMSSADEFFKVWVAFLFVMPSILKFFLLSSLLTIFFTLTNWVGEFEHWAEMIDLHMRVNLRWETR